MIDFSGEEPSKASLLKIIGNIFIVNMIETLAEGHVLSEKTGLGDKNLQKFLSVLFPGPYMIYSKKMTTGQYYTKEVRYPEIHRLSPTFAFYFFKEPLLTIA